MLLCQAITDTKVSSKMKFDIKEQGFDRFVDILPYVEHSEAIQKMVDSHFLLLVDL